MSPFERLLKQLPPDQRVGAALDLEKLSTDPHSPIYAFYSIILQAMDAKFAEKLAATDANIFELAFEQAKSQAVIQNTIQTESRNLSGDKAWKRGITKSIVNGIVWLVSVSAGSMAILFILLKTEISPLKEVIADHRQIVETLSDDPVSLAAYAKYTNEANKEAVNTAASLHVISKLMTLPQMQMYRGDDGYLMIYGPKSSMPVGTTEDGQSWVKLANPVALVSPDTTPAIDKAREAEKKINDSK
jgi:hypothetical protein